MKSQTQLLDLVYAYNDLDAFPTIGDVARHSGISDKTVRNRIGIARRTYPDLEIIVRSQAPQRDEDNPLSEKPQLFMAHWSAEDCISCLRSMALIDPDRAISRNHFNKYSGISESTWNRFFGTFEEFKRQASIKLSRGARKMELDIARHASRDPMDVLNKERADYAGKYKRDFTDRFRTVLVGSDFHDHDCDPFVRRVFVDTAKRVQPEVIFLNGDMLDLAEFGKYTVDPRTWDVTARIRWLHDLLRELREASPESHIIYLEGNHEFRLLRHLGEATPALKTILADLHGFTVSTLLGLDEFEIEYVGKADLRAWTNKDMDAELHRNQYLLWDMLLGDHFPDGIKQGIPGWNGHHHQLKVTPLYTRRYGASQWVQLPSGHVANAEYCQGEKWNMGFMLVHADTQTLHSTFEPIEVRNFCCVGGQFYYRRPDEAWHKGQEVFAEQRV